MSMDWSSSSGRKVLARLENDRLAWLTTVSADGVPYPSLVWFVWDGEKVVVYSQPNKPKLRNLLARPSVAVNFNSNERGTDVAILHGTARHTPEMTPPHEHPQFLEKYGNRMRAVWGTVESFSREYSEPILITPEHVRGW